MKINYFQVFFFCCMMNYFSSHLENALKNISAMRLFNILLIKLAGATVCLNFLSLKLYSRINC